MGKSGCSDVGWPVETVTVGVGWPVETVTVGFTIAVDFIVW